MHPDVGHHPEVGERAPDADVFNLDVATFRLSALWASSPLALVFLRHYG
jgi:hypothetical protein